MNKQNEKKEGNKIFIYWCISLGLCWLVECFGQKTIGYFGLGIIAAVFFAPLVLYDLIELKFGRKK